MKAQIKNEIVKEELSNIVNEDFLKIKDLMLKEKSFIRGDEDFINSLVLCFTDNEKENTLASAFRKEQFKQRITQVNLAKYKSLKLTIIHEIAHHILNKYCFKYYGHTLEFAIVCYCLQWKLLCNEDDIYETFLRAYDIHEDTAYPLLNINVCQFDSMIKSLKWFSLCDLAQKAEELADKIREKYTVRGV